MNDSKSILPSKNFKVTLGFVVLCWIVYFVSYILPITQFGIIPRTLDGLLGIPFSPFLHGSLAHLIANTSGLLIFGFAIAIFEDEIIGVFAGLIFLGGSATWLLGRSANHIGASGLIFGLFGYLLCLGYFQRRPKYIFISVITLFGYGSMIFGVLPGMPGVSWESHLFGFIAGGAMAKWR